MAKIKNINKLGELDIPSLGLVVAAGATFEVSDEVAAELLKQTENFAPGDKAAAAAVTTDAEQSA